MQIDSVGNAGVQAQENILSITQDNGNATLFTSLLSSALNESAYSIGDFYETDDDTAGLLESGVFFSQESLLSGLIGSEDTENGLENMLALMLAGVLLSGSGIGIEMITALLGADGQSSLYDPYFEADGEDQNTDGGSLEEGTSLQTSGLLAYADQNGGTLSPIPADAWIAVNPLTVNHVDERDPEKYKAVIGQFEVETNERYRVNKLGTGDTYCNIFAWDVTRAMGAEIPHYVNAATGEPAAAGEDGAAELDANATNDWLNTYGKQYGWTEVSAEQAQEYANAGMPAVTSWKNPGGHGHMQVVSPSEDGSYDAARGVAIAQAGRNLYDYGYITSVYGQSTLGNVQYFAHI